MPTIVLETRIKAGIEICFDLSRSIDLHRISTKQTNEKAIAGITTGLIKMDEYVTWQARHFGITQRLTSKITAYDRPFHFTDEMIQGAFRSIIHDHYFEVHGDVIMKDVFKFEAPLGVLGRLFTKLVLTKYMTRLLTRRNEVIKEYAESGRWKEVPGVKEF